MVTLLLLVIYLSFISLGLPDSLLGTIWPVAHQDLGVPISYEGVVSILVTCGTILSSMNSERLIRRFKTGKVTAFCVLLTAIALLGYSLSQSFLWLILFAIPLGLGAGSVDAGLNNFVALHFKARHMNWLHCFWGLGATIGPMITAYFLNKGESWRMGCRTLSFLQFGLVFILFLSLPLWKRMEDRVSLTQEKGINEEPYVPLRFGQLFRMKGAKPALTAFFCYCAVEATAGLWGSSYLVLTKGYTVEMAAKWISGFYFGITIGRFVSGVLTIKLRNETMIRIGQIGILIGIGILLLPLPATVTGISFLIIGMGCAPIFPAMLHETPDHFGKKYSQAIMGMQMAFAYIGYAIIPPVFGLIAQFFSTGIFPYYMLIFALFMIPASERLNRCRIGRDSAV